MVSSSNNIVSLFCFYMLLLILARIHEAMPAKDVSRTGFSHPGGLPVREPMALVCLCKTCQKVAKQRYWQKGHGHRFPRRLQVFVRSSCRRPYLYTVHAVHSFCNCFCFELLRPLSTNRIPLLRGQCPGHWYSCATTNAAVSLPWVVLYGSNLCGCESEFSSYNEKSQRCRPVH